MSEGEFRLVEEASSLFKNTVSGVCIPLSSGESPGLS